MLVYQGVVVYGVDRFERKGGDIAASVSLQDGGRVVKLDCSLEVLPLFKELQGKVVDVPVLETMSFGKPSMVVYPAYVPTEVKAAAVKAAA